MGFIGEVSNLNQYPLTYFLFLRVVNFEGKRLPSKNTFFSLGLWRLKDEKGFIQYFFTYEFFFFLGLSSWREVGFHLLSIHIPKKILWGLSVLRDKGVPFDTPKKICLSLSSWKEEGVLSSNHSNTIFIPWFYRVRRAMRFDLISGHAYQWTIQPFGWVYA
jgi:hypothetical protein